MTESSLVELHVSLLGTPTVERHGQTLQVPRRQVRALLYYLATTLRPIPRERLCYLFWPDVPESAARRNLSHLLTHLRNAMPESSLVLTPGDRIQLDPDRVWSDVVAFEGCCAAESPEPKGTRPARRPEQAIALYRGSFLDGFSLPASAEFEAWMARRQGAYERLYLGVLAELIEKHAGRGDYDAAIAYARRYLATDELAEEIHRRLMGLHAASGDRSAVLRQFERCVMVLERELGVSPLPETRAVYESVLAGRPLPPERSSTGNNWTVLPALDVPLVGREEAWRRLESAYTGTRSGQGRLLFISGEPGIGKSRLVRDFTDHLRDSALVLLGAGQPAGQNPPYYALVQALRAAPGLGDRGLSPAKSLSPTWLAEVSRLLPELRERRPDLPPPVPGESREARTRLLEALCQTALALADGPRPLVLCLDDLHWMDKDTLDWLACMGSRLRERPLLILGTYRSGEREVVEELRRGLARSGSLSELQLGGLDLVSVVQLVRYLTGTEQGGEALAVRLRQSTGGNPFFLLETLRVLVEEGRLSSDLEDLAEGEELPLPDSVRQAVDGRLARLSPGARQVLQAGAVLGGVFGFEVLQRTAGRGELETVNSLEELVARQLLVEQRTSPAGATGAPQSVAQAPGYRFQHELIRQATEATLSPVRCQLLHRRSGRALEQLKPDAAVALARHFDAGGRVKKALRYYAEAVEEMQALFAWQEVERYQGRMLELLDRLDADRSDPHCLVQRGQILTSRAHVRHLQGRLDDRDADLAALASLGQASGDQSLQLLVLLHRVRYLNLGGKYREAIVEGEEGLTLARQLDDEVAQSRLQAHIGFAHYFLGQPQPALVALESARDTSGEQADPEMRGRITHVLGYVYYHRSDYERALAYQQEAYECSCETGDYNRMAWNLMDVGFLRLKLGHFGQAREDLSESLALARRIAARPAEAYALTLLGDWDLYRGHYARALQRFRKSLSMQIDVGSEHGVLGAEEGAGWALYHLGDLPAAREALEQALNRARAIHHQRHIALALIRLALVEVARDSPSTARSRLREALDVARKSECPENVAVGLLALARTERKAGEAAAALERAHEAADEVQAHRLLACQSWVELEAGAARLAQDDPEAALEHTTRAVAALPHMHEAWIGSEEVYHAHTRALQALGRATEAEAQRRQAAQILQAKAARIPDLQLRQRYLRFCQSRPR